MGATELTLPLSQDLIDAIRFDAREGKIWFGEQRMLLLHASGFGQLRKELIASLGSERAKYFLMRFGYHAGMKDAEVSQKVRPDLSLKETFLAGPQMHTIRGMVKVVPTSLTFDRDAGQYYGEFDWFDSYEVSNHQKEHGQSSEPVCWSLLGYASGYTSFYMGKSIIYKETQCGAMGHSHCKIVGKPAEEWEADDPEIDRFMLPDPVQDELFALRCELVKLREQEFKHSSANFTLPNSIGQSAAYQAACHLLEKAAQSKVSVLLLGETGVGKEAFARGLHAASDRADQPFIAVNCASIPPELIESELFGVEKGAYTGAHKSRPGRFERAQSGTIFLDEIVELSPRSQAALLRVLQEQELERVGDENIRHIDVRVVAATNEDLAEAVQKGTFRADLYYRLNVFPIHIPPLRERKEDIPLLTEYFLNKYSSLYKKHVLGVSDRSRELLMQYDWPGNIREFENMIERGVILTEHNHEIETHHLFPQQKSALQYLSSLNTQGFMAKEPCFSAHQTQYLEDLLETPFNLDDLEEQIIQLTLKKTNGNISEAARRLGLTRPALAYRLKKVAMPA
ncbi:sigma 54-interacting transcriptional regulator [Alcaligenes aquatilis]|uniref:Sigma-54-dependent Fis family transcriptional regulator n=2 Tax=Alcaligenes TaxID=507 RepID=A0AB33CRY4_ALCFA|nr:MULTISPECIES: sigma-54-dependent Fis family transcriptional regulator [Alcaligenes]ASR89480.1 sigma-54-dependent Fis family transcriptional regulator [Alcaligenes faecalis]MCC9162810.1 sigma 54-interacting transcriptional regulator [Alcaligenes sp. MMA]UQN37590.1 sigma 54-interacting transcriptional regulator [Alcaligenes aquatilis]UYY88872.1 sigma 54-interacting transcriptional regulator [Alcaligenes sp. SMD-FA]HBQ87985.1 sigma-54-dependent Fis family transcriptional regulator [Alcaligenes